MADEEPERRSAASRLEEEDRLRPEADDPRRRPEVPRPGNRYAWVVGIVALMGIGVLLLTTSIPNKGAGIRGPSVGDRLPSFAAAQTDGNFDDDNSDANVFQTRKDARSAGRSQSACEVRARHVLNSCVLRKAPAVLTVITTDGTDCEPQVDRVERMRRSFPRVRFAVVMSGNKHSEALQIARNRRWTLPVGVDPDGAVINLLGVGVCPTTIFTNARGRVVKTELGNLTERQLRADARRIDSAK